MNMKIGIVTSSISRNAGGLFYSVRALAQNLSSMKDCQVEVHGIEDEFTKVDLQKWAPVEPSPHASVGPSTLGYVPSLSEALRVSDCDLLHTHGIWQWPSAAVYQSHRKSGVPYLVAPRGSLDPWALANSRWKKEIAKVLYENNHLKSASCLHALCESEVESFRSFGLKNPICKIPNGVDLPCDLEDLPVINSINKKLLFISRIHPKKGLVKAIQAWSALVDSEQEDMGWEFLIVGWDQNGHRNELIQLCEDNKVHYKEQTAASYIEEGSALEKAGILFLGPAYDQEKDTLLKNADAFILSSYSEGLPMTVLQAWAFGLPAIITPECNIPEGAAAGATISVSVAEQQGKGENSVYEGMKILIDMTDTERTSMGAKGKKLVEKNFTWSRIAEQQHEVYAWLLGGGPKPDCVC